MTYMRPWARYPRGTAAVFLTSYQARLLSFYAHCVFRVCSWPRHVQFSHSRYFLDSDPSEVWLSTHRTCIFQSFLAYTVDGKAPKF